MDWLDNLYDFLDAAIEFFSKGGMLLVFAGVLVVFFIKLGTFLKKIRKGKDYLWKEKILSKIG